MEKAVFLGSQTPTNQVYSREIMEELMSEMDFVLDNKAIDKFELSSYRQTLHDVSYIFSTWGMYDLTSEEIDEYFPSVKAVFYAAGSVQHFARNFLNKGILVFSAWAANAVPVAEYTLAQISLANTGFFQRLHKPGSGYGGWQNKYPDVEFPGNYEAAVGIIGVGMIGKMVVEKIQASLEHIRVLVFDPFLSAEKAKELNVSLCDLKTLFSESDVISNHLANNPQTVGMLNGELFRLMKPHATFINTGRGAQVAESEMIEALKKVPTRAAVLDVTWPEPPVEDSPLYTMDNVYLTPHIAGSLGNEVHRMAEYMLKEYRSYAAGRETKYHVTLKMLETMA